jgi:cyclic beta-1,2-glucan synthetase
MAGLRGGPPALRSMRLLRQLPLPAEALALLDPAAGLLPEPVRGTLFGRERLQQHAQSLAQAQPVERRRRRRRPPTPPFFPRLADNLAALRHARRYLELIAQGGEALSPAAETLLDHIHLIEAQVPEIRASLPPEAYDALPKLRLAPLAGLPRAYGIAWAYVTHTDSGFDPGLLAAFVHAYQEVDELTLAELQALPGLLRVVLTENLARLAERVAATKAARAVAHWCCDHEDGLTEAQLDALLDALQRRGLRTPFLGQMSQRMVGAGPANPSRWLTWLNAHVADAAAELAQAQAGQAANNVSVTNAVQALRAISAFDWPGFIDRVSPMLQKLRRSPAFAADSRLTQAQCAAEVQRLARRLKQPETAVAQRALELCEAAEPASLAQRAGPAYFLIGDGLGQLATAFDQPQAARRLAPRLRWLLYIGSAVALTVGLMALVLRGTHLLPWAQLLSVLLLAVPASACALALVQRLLAEALPARALPRLALADGLGPAQRTLVVVPCVLGTSAEITERVRALEQHHLANPERETQFALLSDWPDAPQHLGPGDALLLDTAREAIAQLNERHSVDGGSGAAPRFLLLHRDRGWSASEGAWIGWDRKRGQLAQLLAHLAGTAPPPFIDLGDESRIASDVVHLVTLDADTLLPPGSLRELVAVAAHPLNEPQVDAESRRVVAGYGLLQPRLVAPLLPPHRLSAFGWLAGAGAARAVPAAPLDALGNAQRPAPGDSADVLQDLFGEGSFAGQGLLQVQAAQAVLAGRVPEEQLFGPDLYESLWARCATLSDVTLVEAPPLHPDQAAARRHRLTRGDWQRAPLLRTALHERVGALNLWKLIDRLRASLLAPTALALLWWSCALGALAAGRTVALVLAAFALGPGITALAGLVPRRDGIAWGPFLRAGGRDLGRALAGAAWQFALLLDEAILQLDAIGRAVWRRARSHRHLLQWTLPALAGRSPADGWRRLVRRHEPTLAVALAWLMLGLLQPTSDAGWIVGLGLLWALTPAWTWLAARPLPPPPARRLLSTEDRHYLHDLARDSWRLFERTVGPDDHHLPPAVLQVEPQPLLARRCSPADIGLYLLATASAHRCGFIGTAELIERLDATLSTLETLPRYRGHLPRLIDTATLQVAAPAAVSTAASGQLAACLWSVGQACRELALAPAPHGAMEQALQAAAKRLRHVRESALRGFLAEPELQALLTEDLWGLWRRAPAVLRDRLDAAQALWRELAPPEDRPQWMPVADLLRQLDSLLRDREVDRDRWAATLRALAERADALVAAMDFGFLYDAERRLLRTGYRLDLATLEAGHHELLADQARLASYVAIAKGEVPEAHWGALARPFVEVRGEPALRSQVGALADYLAPALMLDEPANGLFAGVHAAAVQAQRDEGQAQDLPWGRSDSACFAQDPTLAFQFDRFGCARLALARVSPEERVVAPHASVLAGLVAPVEATANLRRLERLGARDVYGFIDALDFTRSRQGEDGRPQRVACFVAAHHGMALVALCNLLHDEAVRQWFARAPQPRSHATLLQETLPREIVYPPGRSPWREKPREPAAVTLVRTVDLSVAQRGPLPTQWLGNGSYGISLDAHGAGTSRWRGHAISRWRDDALRNGCGSWVLMRRSDEVEFHSLTRAPNPHPAARYVARLHPDRVEYEARAQDWATQMSAWVGDDDAEFREVALHNLGDDDAEFELLTCLEVSLAPQRDDEAHPAAAKRVVRAHLGDASCLVLERPAAADGGAVWAAHFLATADAEPVAVRITCDRARLLPRLGSMAQLRPIGTPATRSGEPLPTGLDPVASLAVRIVVPAHAQRRLCFATAAADDAVALQGMVDKYRHGAHVQHARLMSGTLARIRQRELRIEAIDVAAIQDLGTLMLAHVGRHRSLPAVPLDRRALWRFAISGELPIALVRIGALQGLPVVRALLAAQRLWSLAGLDTDLVIVDGEPASADGALHAQIDALRASLGLASAAGVHLLHHDDLSTAELAALQACARVDLLADGRPLARLLAQTLAAERPASGAVRAAARGTGPAQQPDRRWRAAITVAPRPDDIAGGSFDDDGAEYRIAIDGLRVTPRPWANVLANDGGFGCVVSEAGGGFTWARDSRLHRLTPWSNDPLLDPAGEHFLLQDAITLDTWGLLPSVDRNGADGYRVAHAPGESRFEHERGGVAVDVRVSVHPGEPAKLLQVRLRHAGTATRVLRLVGMVEWVLGAQRAERMTLATAFAPEVQAVLATQLDHGGGFGEATAFLMLLGATPQQWTCARSEFFGPQGRLTVPRAFAGAAGVGLDPCGALESTLTLEPGATVEFAWVIGHADSPEAALALAERLRAPNALADAVTGSRAEWAQRLHALRVHTPDPLFDALVNHWLLHQSVSCGLRARASVYAAPGAIGYRDGLQQALALLYAEPQRVRDALLEHAARQYAEGDVQHEWHPATGAGRRTRCTDDALWLPYALQQYLEVSGDREVLDEPVGFIEGPPVPDGAAALHDVPTVTETQASLYEHAALAIEHGRRTGVHGLPLIGSGDWCEAMDRVGIEGRGESVWLGWLLWQVLRAWAPLAQSRGDLARADAWDAHAQALEQALARHGWDGRWFRRAYFDDGQPLGSHLNDAAQIELSTQAWAALTLPMHDERAGRAMAEADARLVDRRVGAIDLLRPALPSAPVEVGRLQALPPGVRDNGGQLTLAGAWALAAQARLGRATQAWEYFMLLSPPHRGRDTTTQRRYRLEPYAVADDLHTQGPLEAQGGWSWTTPAAAVLYRAAIESLLGLVLRGDRLCLAPCLPPHWPGAQLTLRWRGREIAIVLQVGDVEAVPAPISPDEHMQTIAAGEWVALDALPARSTLVVRLKPPAPSEDAASAPATVAA